MNVKELFEKAKVLVESGLGYCVVRVRQYDECDYPLDVRGIDQGLNEDADKVFISLEVEVMENVADYEFPEDEGEED